MSCDSHAVGVRPGTAVWWGAHQPAPAPRQSRGRPRTRMRRDARHPPISVLDLARALPPGSWRTIEWREGTNAPLASRFARVRCRAAHGNRPRDAEWLLIEWSQGEAQPTHHFLSNLPATVSRQELVATVKMRWRIERDYLELKQELGLGHYEGRNWRGFHHHASLCIAAYGFLMLERLAGGKKTPLDYKHLPYPRASARAGLGPLQRHVPWSIATVRHRLACAIARRLPRCPCCGKPYRRATRD